MAKPKWLDDHACRFNDGKDECSCYRKAYEDAVMACYLDCIAVGCGDTEYSEAIRSKFPDIVVSH